MTKKKEEKEEIEVEVDENDQKIEQLRNELRTLFNGSVRLLELAMAIEQEQDEERRKEMISNLVDGITTLVGHSRAILRMLG